MTKSLTAIFVCGLLAGLFGAQRSSANEAPGSAAQLLQAFETGLRAKDQEAILALINWDGVSTDMKVFHREMVSELLKRDVEHVRLLPMTENFPLPFEAGGVRYSLNIVPSGMLSVESARHGASMPFPIGRKGSHFYIAGSLDEDAPDSVAVSKTGIAIQLQNEQGEPLRQQSVVLATPDNAPSVEYGVLFGGVRRFRSDDRGIVMMPLRENTNFYLVTLNAEGFGWLQGVDLTNHAVMTVQPWGRIEGVRMNRGHPVRDEHLLLTLDRDFYGNGTRGVAPVPINHIGNNDVRTDAQGRFVFEHVLPLRFFIDREEKQRNCWGYFWSVTVKPGEAKKLEINTRGRTVFGHVKVGEGVETNINLASFSGALMSVLKDREGSRRTVGFPISTNGTFHADRVEPGDYNITGDIWQGEKRVALLDPVSVRVSDDDSMVEDVPFDMGEVTLKPAVNFMKGDTAPDFSCDTLDGGRITLSDFRGKYVLLDFWATWCGPCVAEMPNVKAVYDAYGKDKRFAMISLSLDSEASAPRKFVQSRGFAWTQGFLGDWSNDKITKSYGAYGIPAIYLIGPDGKVLATDLRGGRIKETVAAALAH